LYIIKSQTEQEGIFLDYHINNISYKYLEKGPMVLNNVDFNIRSGEVTAVVGPSGCGKSTLVNILSGVIPELITSGKLEGDLKNFQNLLVSVVSQSPEDQLFGYGVEDAIAFGIENMGIDHDEIVKRVEYVLDLLNLQHLRGRSIANLSGGQRQAVCIASVLAIYPDILIMDEPVSSLDPNGKNLIQNVLRQMRSSGSTTVIVDNNLEWSSEIVDHVIGLAEGKVIF
jgi:energy-coupling factor transport system ATP-binding protein